MFSDTLTIIKVINFDQKVHWFDISWSECVLFSKSPIQGSKGKSSKTSYQQKPRDSFAKWQLKWAVGHWGWQGANTSCKSSVFKNVCLPSNLWTTFFYISQRPCVFFYFACFIFLFDVQDMETFNVAAQNFVSEAGSRNFTKRVGWEDYGSDGRFLGVSTRIKWSWMTGNLRLNPPRMTWLLDFDFFQWEVGEQ